MAKCTYCKKSHEPKTTSQYKCEITGKYLSRICDNWSPKMKNCKYSKRGLFGRLLDWFVEKFL